MDLALCPAQQRAFDRSDALFKGGEELGLYRYLLPPRPLTDYFLRAAETVRANKARYAEADARARLQRPLRAPHYDRVGRDGEAAER